MKKTPYATYILLAANLIVFFASELLGGSEDYATMLRLGAASAPLIKEGEYWRLFTSMFLHFGFMHLANNMIVLFALGENLENVLGPVRYALLYLLGGLAGNLLAFAHDLLIGRTGISAGASGAVFALLGCYVFLLLKNRRNMPRMVVGRVIFGAALALLPGFYTPGVDAFAHLGGFLFGLLFGVFMKAPGRKRQRRE